MALTPPAEDMVLPLREALLAIETIGRRGRPGRITRNFSFFRIFSAKWSTGSV
jgi:hypothetical protein